MSSHNVAGVVQGKSSVANVIVMMVERGGWEEKQ